MDFLPRAAVIIIIVRRILRGVCVCVCVREKYECPSLYTAGNNERVFFRIIYFPFFSPLQIVRIRTAGC